mgnify:FL=1|tara:strand:- start:260 stop:640 length:381 start_codon:yes stop_codon:yes gene_type:complete
MEKEKIDLYQITEDAVGKLMKSARSEMKSSDVDYGEAAIKAFRLAKQHIKQSKIGLEAYLDLVDKHEKRNLDSIDDFDAFELPLNKEHTLALIQELDQMSLRILAGEITDVLESKTKQKKKVISRN